MPDVRTGLLWALSRHGGQFGSGSVKSLHVRSCRYMGSISSLLIRHRHKPIHGVTPCPIHPNRSFFTSHRTLKSSLPSQSSPGETSNGLPALFGYSGTSLAFLGIFPDFDIGAYPPVSTIASILVNAPGEAYGATIIILTLLFRLGVTLPATLWQRRRTKRLQETVAPIIKERMGIVAKDLAKEFRTKENGRSQEGYQAYLVELKKRAAAEQYALHRKYNTHPTFTQYFPLLINIPVLILYSVCIRTALEMPLSPIVTAEWFWIPKLGDPDLILSFIGGMTIGLNSIVTRRKGEMAFDKLQAQEAEIAARAAERQATAAKVERPIAAKQRELRPPPLNQRSGGQISPSVKASSAPIKPTQILPSRSPQNTRSFVTTSMDLAERKTDDNKPIPYVNPGRWSKAARDKLPQSVKTIRTSIFMSNIMFGSAVVFWMFSSNIASGMVLYWTTSCIFSLCQNIYFGFYDKPNPDIQRSSLLDLEAVK